jgi:DNA-binding winged helix-turn-helix (wHTH) protein
MAEQHQREQVVRFGVFEVDRKSGELRKRGVRVKLQDLPFRFLSSLLETPGEIVPREELIGKLWPNGTFVDHEQSLGSAVYAIRQALGDSADNPRFVETIPRRGYRFIPTDLVQGSGVNGAAHNGAPGAPVRHDPLARYKVTADVEETDASIKYLAEDTDVASAGCDPGTAAIISGTSRACSAPKADACAGRGCARCASRPGFRLLPAVEHLACQ